MREIPIEWDLLECGHYGHREDRAVKLRLGEDQRFIYYRCKTCRQRSRAVRHDQQLPK